MAKKPNRKMPADVKRTLSARRKPRAPRPPAEPKQPDCEVFHVRIPDIIDARALGQRLGSPEGMAAFARFMGLEALGADMPVIPGPTSAEFEDNAAVERLGLAMTSRLAEKRERGYSGWNDPTQCDASALAKKFMAKLYSDAHIPDLGNYLAFLFSTASGQYALQVALRDHLKGIDAAATAEAKQLREQLSAVAKELEVARGEVARGDSNLARALGYIDRVTEAEAPLTVPDMCMRIGVRGPQLDQGMRERNGASLMHDFDARR